MESGVQIAAVIIGVLANLGGLFAIVTFVLTEDH